MAKSELNETHLEIISQLDLNARTSNSEIGRKLGISKNTVNAYIRDMEQKGIIKGYFTTIDFFRLGYQSFRLYLKLQNANNKTEKEMIDYLEASPLTWWCSHAMGRFDIGSLFYCNSPEQFREVWNNFNGRFHSYIKEAIVVPHFGQQMSRLPITNKIYKQADVFIGKSGAVKIPRPHESHDLPMGFDPIKIPRTEFQLKRELQWTTERCDVLKVANFQCDNHIKIDKKDKSILRTLSTNARAPFSIISKTVGLSVTSLRNRVNNLIEKNVVLAFRPLVDMEKFGYTSYKVDFKLSSIENKKTMCDYLMEKSNVSHLIQTVGWADIETRLYSKSTKELHNTIKEFRDEFSVSMQDYDFFAYPEIVKEQYMPDF